MSQIFRWGYVHLGATAPDDMLVIPRLKADMTATTEDKLEDVLFLVHDKPAEVAHVGLLKGLLKATVWEFIDQRHTFAGDLHFDNRLRYGFGELAYATGEVTIWPRVWSPRNCDFRGDMDNSDNEGTYKRYKLDWRRKNKLELFHHDWVEGRYDDAIGRLG